MAGRNCWSSLSDFIGRKTTYAFFFPFRAALYTLTPQTGKLGSVELFVLGYGIIMSMYGGGFATIPAYLRDLFGTGQVGAIHGRLLTAWSLAGVAGPVLVNYLRDSQIKHGVAKADAYTITMYIMAGLLVIGFICNFLVRTKDVGKFLRPQQSREPMSNEPSGNAANGDGNGRGAGRPEDGGESVENNAALIAMRWLFVGVPLAWGILFTIHASWEFFN
jgi:hypothetical protein